MSRVIKLPDPRAAGCFSVEQTLNERRSRRNYSDNPITVGELSQILWAAYGSQKPAGESGRLGGNTSPSAGGLYPLHIYLAAGKVDDLPAGLYEYRATDHSVNRLHDRDIRQELCAAAWCQEMIRDAPATLAYAADFSKVTGRYGERGIIRYIPMDVGHSAQNVYLQAEALGLGTCAVGAFDDAAVKQVLEMPARLTPMYLMPVGHYREP